MQAAESHMGSAGEGHGGTDAAHSQIESVDKSSEQAATHPAPQHSYVQDLGSRAYETVSFLKNQVSYL